MRWVRGSSWLMVAALLLALGACTPEQPPQSSQAITPPPKCGVTIRLNPGASATCGMTIPPGAAHVSLTLDEGSVRWRNTTNSVQTVRFDAQEWIFVEPHGDIVLPAKGQSGWYTIAAGTAPGIPHKYSVTPLRDGCPPQDPAITADP